MKLHDNACVGRMQQDETQWEMVRNISTRRTGVNTADVPRLMTLPENRYAEYFPSFRNPEFSMREASFHFELLRIKHSLS